VIGVCPNCGKPFRIEEGEGGEGWRYCAEVCIAPAALPTGERLQADQATIKYTDGNMNELSRSEYLKLHGIDPMPVLDAVKAWREEQMERWKA
jgi:hypothetical protein